MLCCCSLDGFSSLCFQAARTLPLCHSLAKINCCTLSHIYHCSTFGRLRLRFHCHDMRWLSRDSVTLLKLRTQQVTARSFRSQTDGSGLALACANRAKKGLRAPAAGAGPRWLPGYALTASYCAGRLSAVTTLAVVSVFPYEVPPRSHRRTHFPPADPNQYQTLQPWQRFTRIALSDCRISRRPPPHGQTHTAAITG